MKGSDIVGMWIVALALVGAVAAQGASPDVSPRLGHGVEVVGLRPSFAEPDAAGPAVPVSMLVQDKARTPGLTEVLQGLTRRVFKC
jgi:hypothetical protein